ncbi:YbaN family protein [Aurantimonas sp. C2-6-R+9]|uniref:YbaN family protein n=1 Tax=unclassified Aurantimonas TaxID=2638230 RepID=UPI002E16E596|nr:MULTISPECIES: YbaN family protein [unclassified Aurantimonas]MEC5293731.1 YbaN family protein [Aurantimonas sp. C2-3-R2]MEC5383911.1 YbaN family protein [Aurantimonas sp. C2-6-R+9]MEC5414785.1 YbaN family protein [Aurantimonas sp. C2-4-R8]
MLRWLHPIGRSGLGLPRLLWFVVGAFSLALAGLGVVLPVLPTTPFIILATFAFGRSAPGLQARLQRSHVFGPMIAEWQEHGVIAPRYKTAAIAMMAGAMLLSLVMSVSAIVIAIQAVCMAAAVGFILSRPNGAAARVRSEMTGAQTCERS